MVGTVIKILWIMTQKYLKNKIRKVCVILCLWNCLHTMINLTLWETWIHDLIVPVRLPYAKTCLLKFNTSVCWLIIVLKPLTAFSVTDFFYFSITPTTCKIQFTLIWIRPTVASTHGLVDIQAIIDALSYTKKMIIFVLQKKISN